MFHSQNLKVVVLVMFLFSTAVLGIAQSQQPKTTIKTEPIRPTAPSSGAEMYKEYCAACHGPKGKGDGPAVTALKTAPTDLTMLSKVNGGAFPEMHVAQVLRGGPGWPAHGSPEMPVWGPLFSAVSSSNQGVVNLRISNLTKYLESLQSK